MAAWKKLDVSHCRGDGIFARWLRKVVMNATLRRLRRLLSRPEADQITASPLSAAATSNAPDPNEVRRQREDRERLVECLAKLPQPEREIVFLRHFENRTWEQIAEILNRGSSTVRLKYQDGWLYLCRLMAR